MYKNYPQFDKTEIIAYLRKSRSDDPLLELEEVLRKHEEILDEYGEKYLNGKIPNENKYREIKSSETINDRPEMLRLLKDIENSAVKGVLVVEVQRLSRGDLEDAGRLIKLLRYTNTYVLTPQKIYDLRDEYDRDAFERELKRGNDYLEYTKKILNRGKLLAVKEGNFIATYAPYGYKKSSYKEGKRKCTTLEIIPDQAEMVKLIFDLYVNKDYGFNRIANTLNDLHVKPARGDFWKTSTIKEIIGNITYTGKIRWNYRATVKYVEDQEVIKSRPRNNINDQLIFEGKHDAIISDELFNAAQQKRGKNVPIRIDKRITNPLAGLFYCGKCGRAMKLRHANKKCAPRYECTEMQHCGNGSITYDDMMNRVIDTLEDCIKDFKVKLKEDNHDEITRHQIMITTLEKRLKDLEEKEIKQWDNLTSGEMPKHIFDTLNNKVLKEKEEVKEALCLAHNSAPAPIDYEERVTTFVEALNALRDINVSPELKNAYLRQIIARITIVRERPIRLTKELAEKMGVPYPHRLCWHNFPFELDITLK